jgi:hypothetical protein
MLGRLALGLGVAAATSGKPARRAAPIRGGCLGYFGIVLCVGIMIYGNATHTWTVAWFIVLPLVCSAFIAVGAIISGINRGRRVQQRLDQLPTQRPRATASQLRERANALSGTVPAQNGVTTLRRQLSDADLEARMLRVAAILIQPCPVCSALGGQSCPSVPDQPAYLLDRDRHLIAHGRRIGFAVKQGTASVQDVVAQFDNHVPDEVWEMAL